MISGKTEIKRAISDPSLAKGSNLIASANPARDLDNQVIATHEQEPYLTFIAPQSWLGKEVARIGHEFSGYRKQAIHTLPAIAVNHGSNIVGATQLVGEALMFKASGNMLYQGEKFGSKGAKATDYFHGSFQKWLEQKSPHLAHRNSNTLGAKTLKYATPVIEPIYNIVNDAVTRGLTFRLKDLSKPGFYKESFKSLFDLKKATELDRASSPGGKLINRWQTRATFLGMLAMTVAALMPDDKDNPEEVKKLSEMATLNPTQYTLHRIATAINPLEWFHNKRAFTGLMMTICGMCTFVAGFRNVSKLNGREEYFWNKAHGINGIITGAAGSQLIMAPTAEQGWSRFGSILWGRMAFLPSSIGARYAKKDPHANFYSAGQASFQTANITSFLIAGAEKLPDGTVIDHKEISEKAKRHAKQLKQEAKENRGHRSFGSELHHNSSTTPLPTITANGAALESPTKTTEVSAA